MFFTLSKLFWLVFSPLNFLMILFVFGILTAIFFSNRAGSWFVLSGTVLFIILGVFPVGHNSVASLENRYPVPQKTYFSKTIDGIIVLGGGINTELSGHYDYPVMGNSASRLTEFLRLARAYPDARMVYAGGSGDMFNQDIKGADVAEKLFRNLGFDTGRMIFDNQSRNTYENALYAKSQVNPEAGENWILITSSYHMPRAVAVFCAVGWPVTAYPADHETMGDIRLFPGDFDVERNFELLSTGLKEWIGLAAYYFFGKTQSILPPPVYGDKNAMLTAPCS